jgi:hypothetical protein
MFIRPSPLVGHVVVHMWPRSIYTYIYYKRHKMASNYDVHSPPALISEMLPKSSLKLISSTCSSIWLSTYLICLVDVFFNRQSALPMGAICAPLLTDLFLYSYEPDFIQVLLKKNEKMLTRSFNFTFVI